MAFKNTYTTLSVEQIVAKIQKSLVSHHAQKIMYDYDDLGNLTGISFGIPKDGQMLGIKLPARVKECEAILKKEGLINPSKKDHAVRVAWCNLKDWIEAQMSMIDVDMVKMEEVFLPYMIMGNSTIYQIMSENNFKGLPSGDKNSPED